MKLFTVWGVKFDPYKLPGILNSLWSRFVWSANCNNIKCYWGNNSRLGSLIHYLVGRGWGAGYARSVQVAGLARMTRKYGVGRVWARMKVSIKTPIIRQDVNETTSFDWLNTFLINQYSYYKTDKGPINDTWSYQSHFNVSLSTE